MHFHLYVQQSIDDEIHPVIDLLLFELDNVIDDELKSIPDDLISECQFSLILWSIDGREDNDYSVSTPEDHGNANRLMEKIRQTYLLLGGNEFDRKGFVRDAFTLQEQWIITAVQFYRFIDYYDHSNNSTDILKLIEWNVYHKDYIDGFVPMYHLERSSKNENEYIYVLGRKRYPLYHESLISFKNVCPSYMKLKSFIIGDITGETPLTPIATSGYLD